MLHRFEKFSQSDDIYLYRLVGLNDIKTVQANISTNIKWNENIFGSNSAKISCQITVNSEGF